MHDFPEAEYQARWRRARDEMKARGLDALLVTDETNYMYFTGHTVTYWERNWLWEITHAYPFAFILPVDGAPAICTVSFERENARADTFVTDVRPWAGLPFSAGELAEALKSLGLSRAQIGCELGPEQRVGMPFEEFSRLKRELPGAQFLDGTAVLEATRVVKSDLEVERVRTANEITVAALESFYGQARKGLTELEAARMIRQAMIEHGADRCRYYLTYPARPGAAPTIHYIPLDREFQEGECVYMDLGAAFRNYMADINRVFYVGRAGTEVKEKYQLMLRCEEAMLRAIVPGARACDVFEAFSRTMKEAGAAEKEYARVGHGLGMCVERPSLSGNDTTRLREGMVLTVEPRTDEAFGCLTVEDNVLVTSSGFEMLTPGRRELIELP